MLVKSDKDAWAVWRQPDFRSFIFGRFFITMATQMQAVVVGWQVYELTGDVLNLGLIGLAEAVPFLLVSLFSGYVADLVRRKKIILISLLFFLLASGGLLLISKYIDSVYAATGLWPVFLVIVCTGFARGFYFPAASALLPQILPRSLYSNSATWNSALWHIAAIAGPAAGGLIYGFGNAEWTYAIVVILTVVGFLMFTGIRKSPLPAVRQEGFFRSLSAGFRFVFRHQVILGAISLDMFAVLFGGAVALLPAFADSVLHVGPQGLGILRAAPAAGAVAMSVFQAYHPPLNHSGIKLLAGVAGFGTAYLLFALSDMFIFSVILLFISGVFDNISVVIRSTILQLMTPDDMRGRVAAVNSIFIGSSNEIGAFESGVAARLMGLVPSVIFGSIMTFGITGAFSVFAPRLRKLNLKDEMAGGQEKL